VIQRKLVVCIFTKRKENFKIKRKEESCAINLQLVILVIVLVNYAARCSESDAGVWE
jgi:hypothetical protein